MGTKREFDETGRLKLHYYDVKIEDEGVETTDIAGDADSTTLWPDGFNEPESDA